MAKKKRTPEQIRESKRLRQQRKREAERRAAIEIWEDRDGKARPTPERRAKGAFRLVTGENAGLSVAVDDHATTLDRMRGEKLITPEQSQGGHDFAALMERTRLVSAGRSCIDFEPVGHEPLEEASAQEERDERDRRELYLACGMLTWAELRRVCVDGYWPRDVERLRAGLDLCAQFWGKRC